MLNSSTGKTIRIAVVGDVHDLWDPADDLALDYLRADLVLLVGDFGNEAVEVVRAVATLDRPKAVILGNHDAWYTASSWGRAKCPYDPQKEDRVQQQLDLLGDSHVGYGKRDFPDWNLTVIGSRPFSWGGLEWKNQQFYQQRFGVNSFAESTDRILAAVHSATGETLIFLGHCGPRGLGDRPDDPCGKDWFPPGGDYGDPDFAEAIAKTLALGKQVPLVVFGHMHHHLRHSSQSRRCWHVDSQGIAYLNAAQVPRILSQPDGCYHHFGLATLCRHSKQPWQVSQIAQVWVNTTTGQVQETVVYTQPVASPPIS